jgi:hypothetical protein
MGQLSSNKGNESDRPLIVAEDEEVWAAARQAILERRGSMSAPEATAVRLDTSADSHDRIATMYEEIAERTSIPDECREIASRHRVWAAEDRDRAAQLRRLADRQVAIDRVNLLE